MFLQTEKVSPFTAGYKAVKRLQKTAFPKSEQMPLAAMHLLALRKGIEYTAYYDSDLFCGITYTVVTGTDVFVLYLAVDDAVRSNGYGSEILAFLKEKYPAKQISPNVEPPDNGADNIEQRIKRIAFYKRNGFSLTGYRAKDYSHEYLIMSTAHNFKIEGYKGALNKLSMHTYVPKIKYKG